MITNSLHPSEPVLESTPAVTQLLHAEATYGVNHRNTNALRWFGNGLPNHWRCTSPTLPAAGPAGALEAGQLPQGGRGSAAGGGRRKWRRIRNTGFEPKGSL